MEARDEEEEEEEEEEDALGFAKPSAAGTRGDAQRRRWTPRDAR